jgi:predicted permease
MSRWDDERRERWYRYFRFWGTDVRADVHDEIEFHMEGVMDELRAAGLSDADARRAARERFGDVQRVADRMRELAARRERSTEMMERLRRLAQGTRQGIRRLAHEWRYSLAVIGILALGVGPAAGMISVITNVLLKPLDYREPARLVMLRVNLATLRNHPGLSPGEAYTMRQDSIFDNIAIETRLAEVSMGPPGELVPLSQLGVSTEMLSMLGVHAYVGRVFSKEDLAPVTAQNQSFGSAPGAQAGGPPQRMMIDYETWQAHFSSNPKVIGTFVPINGTPTQIIGVLPPGFQLVTGRAAPRRVDVYTAFQMPQFWNAWMFPSIARLKPNQTFAQAQAALDAIAPRIKREHPDIYLGELRFTITPLLDDMTQGSRPAFRAAGAAVILLFIIAFANATALVLARMRSRETSFAVRYAIGATPRALIAHALGENLLLALTGAIAGAALAPLTVSGIRVLIPHTVPRWQAVAVGWDQLLWAAGLSVVGLLLLGLAPLWRLARGRGFLSLRSGSAQGGAAESARSRLVLVGAQMVLTVVLAFGCVQLARSAVRLRHVDLGFDPNVLTLRVAYDARRYSTGRERAELYQRIRDRVRQVPGVMDAGVVTHIPLSGSTMMDGYEADLSKEPSLTQSANYQGVSPGYFRTMHIPIVQGRDFTDEEDRDTLPVIIVDESLVRTVFTDERSAIGKTLRIGWGLPNARIVGVVGHARTIDPGRDVRPQIYCPIGNLFQQAGVVLARTRGDARALAPAITTAINEASPGRAVSEVAMLTENVAAATSTLVAVTGLVAVLALSAGLLSAVGLYLVIAFVVHERRRSTAIRTALGATAARVMWDNFLTSAGVLAVALPLGTVAALLVSPALDDLVYGVKSRDPLSLTAAIAIAAVAGLLGMYVPLKRAANANVLEALRDS